jgi:biotin synthase
MPNESLDGLASGILNDARRLTRDEALRLCRPDTDLYDLLPWAHRLRRKYKGDTVKGCSIVSARTGACSENCAFCAQSAHYRTPAPEHGFVPPERVAEAAREAARAGSYALGIVTSGFGPRDDEMATYLAYLDAAGRGGAVEKHLDVGILTDEQVRVLKAHGMTCCGHNLETSRRHFPKICTTHTYAQRVETLRLLRRHGVRVCSGGVFGMGEDWEDRVDLALELRDLDAANVPLNFLHRIPGTPLQELPPLAPLEILRVIALYRFILFDRDLGVYGGREANLRDLQSWIFYAGANAVLLGDYLTTCGRSAELDQQMIRDLGLRLDSTGH